MTSTDKSLFTSPVRSCKNNAKRTIYLAFDIEKEQKLITQLGKCKYGRSCLYVNKLVDIDIKTLRKLIMKSKDVTWN